jgi:hypothetical protein
MQQCAGGRIKNRRQFTGKLSGKLGADRIHESIGVTLCQTMGGVAMVVRRCPDEILGGC